MSMLAETLALCNLIEGTPLASSSSIEILRIGGSISGGENETFYGECGEEISRYLESGDDLEPACERLKGDEALLNLKRNEGYSVRILLLGLLWFLESERDSKGCTTNSLRVTSQALQKLCEELSISATFLDAVLKPSIWSKQSGGSFHRFKDGNLESVDGFYHYFNEWHLGPLHTLFSFDVVRKSTMYLLIDCPSGVKRRIKSSAKDPKLMCQPLAIDILIAEECALWRENFINDHYNQIFDWHERNGSMDPPLKRNVNTVDNLQRLHQLSRTWNMIYEDLDDLSERLDFLLSTAAKLSSAGLQTTATTESLVFIKERNHLRRRRVSSFGERTKLIIHLVFSIDSQMNNLTNLEIAGTSSDIARETQRDNSSMIKIATMTMLFLPGTFISAIFSMVFFNSGVDGNGNEYFQTSSTPWLYFAITVPVTLLVGGVYRYWRRRREGRVESRNKESGSDLELGSTSRS